MVTEDGYSISQAMGLGSGHLKFLWVKVVCGMFWWLVKELSSLETFASSLTASIEIWRLGAGFMI